MLFCAVIAMLTGRARNDSIDFLNGVLPDCASYTFEAFESFEFRGFGKQEIAVVPASDIGLTVDRRGMFAA